MTKALELQGRRFGRLITISRAENSKSGKARWNCVCDCGATTICVSSDLVKGHTISCGCVQSEWAIEKNIVNTRHGMCDTGTYRSWASMKSRCTDTNSPVYKDYGARGITICPEWLESFEAFLIDMGEPPEGYTLDRIDVNKGYCKENCRWATRKEQARNRRNNVWINTPLGRMVVTEAAERFGLTKNVIYGRMKKGWPEEKLLESVR